MSRKNKKRIMSIILITALGQNMIVPYTASALESNILKSHNIQFTSLPTDELPKANIEIAGYSYVGYIENQYGQQKTCVIKKEQSVLPTDTDKQTDKPDTIINVETPLITEVPQTDIPFTEPLPEAKIEHKVRQEVQEVPFETQEVEDATLPKGTRQVVQQGVNGQTIRTFEDIYVDGQLTQTKEQPSNTVPAVPQIIHVGTEEPLITEVPKDNIPSVEDLPEAKIEHKTRTEVQDILFETQEIKDDTITEGERQIVQEGVNGKITTTFDDIYVNGELVQSTKIKIETMPATPQIIHIGSKEAPLITEVPKDNIPSVEDLPEAKIEHKTRTEVQEVPFETQEVKDGTLAEGERQTVQQGQNGKVTKTFDDIYVNGELVQSVATKVETTPATPEIIHVGTKVADKVEHQIRTERQEIPFETQEVKDETLANGERKVVQAGVNGAIIKEIEDTFVNGVLTSSVTKNTETIKPTPEIIHVGTKVAVDKTPVIEQIDIAKTKNQADYAPQSWQAFTAALEVANAVNNKADVTQEEINQAAAQLRQAIANLNVDKTPLVEQINIANTKRQEDYAPDSWQAFTAALETANTVNNKADVTQAEINQAAEQLRQAIANLNVDKTPVVEQINIANTKRQEDYTPESWEAFVAALDAANSVNNKANVTQAEINQAAEQLRQAIADLQKIKTKPTLTLINIDKDELARQAVPSYQLNDKDNAFVKAVVKIKHNGQVIKEVPVNELSATLSQLDYYTPYDVETVMTYNIGQGNVEEVVSTEPLELVLKKIEFKHIQNVELYSKEGDEYYKKIALDAPPSSLNNYFVKIKTKELKEVLLPVSQAEEVQKDGQSLIKLTATLPELVHNDASNEYQKNVEVFINKISANANGYTSFKSLVAAMQNNPTGTFNLASDLIADEVPLSDNARSYLSKEFKGILSGGTADKQFAIYNLKMPLFDLLNGAQIKNINFKDVNISTNEKNIGAVANTAKNTSLQDVAVQGNISAPSNVGGLIGTANITDFYNVAYEGNIQVTNPDEVSPNGGIVGKGEGVTINKAHANVNITGPFKVKKMRAGGIAGFVNKGNISNVYTEGQITNTSPKGVGQIGGIVGGTYPQGTVDNAVSLIKGSDNVNTIHGDSDFADANIKNATYVPFITTGNVDKWSTATTETEAKEKIGMMNITATVNDSPDNNKLNAYDVNYLTLTNAQPDRKIAYYNTEKLLPFYNKEFIVYQGNKIDPSNKLYTTEIVSVTPMHNDMVLTDIQAQPQQVNKLMVHYKDNTVDYIDLSYQAPFKNPQVIEYGLAGGNLIYTPQHLVVNHQPIIAKVAPEMKTIPYHSEQLLNALGYTVTADDIAKKKATLGANATNDSAKQALIAEKMDLLYLKQSYEDIQSKLDAELEKVLSSDKAANATAPIVSDYTANYIKKNKEKLLLGLAYVKRWYNINFDKMNIQDLATYHQDFYGKPVSTLEWLVKLGGSGYNNLLPKNNVALYESAIAPNTDKKTLFDYLASQRQLFTKSDAETWFKQASKAQMIAVPSLEKPDANVDIYQRLTKPSSKFKHAVLPLLTLSKEGVYVISTITTLDFGMYDKYLDTDLEKTDPAAYQKEVEKVKALVERASIWQRNHFDTWWRILKPELKEKLIRDIYVFDAYNIEHKKIWLKQYGDTSQTVLDFFGPIDHYYEPNGSGAYAIGDLVHYVADKMLFPYGSAVFTHELTHLNDSNIYLQYDRRQNMGSESFALGLLQSPEIDKKDVLAINLMFEFDKTNKLNYNSSPQRFQNAEDLHTYMHGAFDVMYTLDYAEAMALVKAGKDVQKQWLNKLENSSGTNVTNIVRALTDAEWDKVSLNTINDFVDNSMITKRDYKAMNYQRNDYFTTSLFSPIYGTAQNDKGSPGELTFKRNAFELLADKGYYGGFVPYTSNQYQKEAAAQGNPELSDKFVAQKIFNGQYASLNDFKKAMFKERIDKLSQLKPITIEYRKKTYTLQNYQDIQNLMEQAIADDLKEKTVTHSLYNKVRKLKQAIYNAYLLQSDEFRNSIYK